MPVAFALATALACSADVHSLELEPKRPFTKDTQIHEAQGQGRHFVLLLHFRNKISKGQATQIDKSLDQGNAFGQSLFVVHSPTNSNIHCVSNLLRIHEALSELEHSIGGF